MTPLTPRQEAEKIVEMFNSMSINIDTYDIDGLCVMTYKMPYESAIEISIKHVEGILEVLDRIKNRFISVETCNAAMSEWHKYNDILHELKSM